MNEKLIIFFSQNLSNDLLYREFIKKNKKYIATIYIFPNIDNKNSRNNHILNIIKRSSIQFLIFKFITISIYNFLSKCNRSDFIYFLKENKISFSYEKIIDDNILKKINNINPKVIFNCSPIIISKSFISKISIPLVNFHGAKLPQYRGAANYFWVMINDEKETNGTLHYINNKLDSGDIIAETQKLNLSNYKTVFEIYYDILLNGQDLICKFWECILENKEIYSLKQNENSANIRSFPKSKDISRLYKNGYKIISVKDLLKIINVIFNKKPFDTI